MDLQLRMLPHLLLHQVFASTEFMDTAVSYSAGHVVLSYVTCLLGCVTTLELLQRRTSTRGLYNWFLLGAAAVTMGAISIWGMHFVANGAIILDHGAPNRQLVYKPTITAISFFVPIIVLMIAFYLLGLPARARQIHVALAGILTGAAVCGMHSLGQYGVDNYTCSYKVKNLVGSAIISIVASVIALGVFFRMRDTWTDSWWKRVICGAILAAAVSGMHWTAAVGTKYRWKKGKTGHGHLRTETTAVASALSMAACIVLLAAAFIRGRRMRVARIKAQRLVLACAYFDEDGKLMVTEEGILPSEKITNHYLEKNFGEDELNRAHATFLWVFKASRNWAFMEQFIPGMTEYIKSDPAAKRYRPGGMSSAPHGDWTDVSLNFAPVFKQLFCMAAQRLADHIHEPLGRLGTLFEEPLDTGTVFVCTPSRTALPAVSPNATNSPDLESGNCIARGKYLFLTRQLNRDEATNFGALGYRFAAVARIAEPMAKRMQINRDNLVARMGRMQLSASLGDLPLPGVHLGCFMLRPSIHKSFDVLVPESMQAQLPHVLVQPGGLTMEQSHQLTSLLDELTVGDVLEILLDQTKETKLDEPTRSRLHEAIVKLADVVGDSNGLMQAKFSARPLEVPCQSDTNFSSTSTCTFLIVRLIRDVHTSSATEALAYVPLVSFIVQQQYQTAGWRDEQFLQAVKCEFGHLLLDSCKRKRYSLIRLGRMSTSAGTRLGSRRTLPPRRCKDIIGRLYSSRGYDTSGTLPSPAAKPDRVDSELTTITTITVAEGGRPFDSPSLMAQMNRRSSTGGTFGAGCWVTELVSLFQLSTEG
ncbi:hypothetical protein ABEF92_002521 [Exophiala dermatitidis]|uniref:MHYT domain-containing protein n=1 Tax=Exophiala dermatitidis (strain ATCC 34100 / CBS 525.76 / NIH/UT8656) TaxID=858893 RepID=H6BL19_EXODN|nr:uncharacterized protein HMPREF1120_00976 [Exophiala dermatitidis NIH/UT8656]EHY52767.1 hypothetical protein HMPREF1120_00976 [Exophiala dermatitidis NIH/UT8656]